MGSELKRAFQGGNKLSELAFAFSCRVVVVTIMEIDELEDEFMCNNPTSISV